MPGPLLAVDAPSLLYRAFFALPQSITDDDGHPVNALLGMANLVLFDVERHDPRAVVLCFGAEAAALPHRALRALPRRPPADARRARAPVGRRARRSSARSAGRRCHTRELEADDLLGSLAKIEQAAGGDALLFTGDRDMFQCVGEHVTVLFPRGGKDGPEVVGPDEVRERYGIEPEQVPDFIALRGDPSDGLPGAKGIGAKGARDLLRKHGTLEGVIAAGRKPGAMTPRHGRRADERSRRAARLQGHRDAARRRRSTRPPDAPTDGAAAAAAARERGMNRLAERLEKLA